MRIARFGAPTDSRVGMEKLTERYRELRLYQNFFESIPRPSFGKGMVIDAELSFFARKENNNNAAACLYFLLTTDDFLVTTPCAIFCSPWKAKI
jgi:hypothetical protein